MLVTSISSAATELPSSSSFSSASSHRALVPSPLPKLAMAASPKGTATIRKDLFSVMPQETRLSRMADPLTQSRINGLRSPTSGQAASKPHFVLLFDFDHTLSTEDSGEKLARDHGIKGPTAIFDRMRAVDSNVRPGGELAAALAHAKEFHGITQQHLADAGKGVALKANVKTVFDTLDVNHADYRLSLFVLSAGPTETIRTALDGVVSAEKVQGTRMNFGDNNAKSIQHVTAGQGKADFIDALLNRLNIPTSHLMFAGDGSSDEVAFRYTRERGGFNILVKDNPKLFPLSHAQVYGDDLFGVIPVVRNHVASVLGEKE